MGGDGSQMVEGKFCYLASSVHPLADDLHLVCASSAGNLDPSAAWKNAFTHCVVGERFEPFSHQAWTARNLRIPTMPWILLRPSACLSPPSRYGNLQHAGRPPTQFYCWKKTSGECGLNKFLGAYINNTFKWASIGFPTSVYDTLAMLKKITFDSSVPSYLDVCFSSCLV